MIVHVVGKTISRWKSCRAIFPVGIPKWRKKR